jgi:hypothetical protein
MRLPVLFKIIPALMALLLGGASIASEPARPSNQAGVPGKGAGAWPGGARADLAVPDSLWRAALAHVNRGGRPLGYTLDEMANYGRDAMILRPVKNLFRDVRGIHRFSGKTAEDLVANASNTPEMVLRAFGLTDVSAGRMLPMPDSASWSADWIPGEATPAEALDALLAYSNGAARGSIRAEDRRAWDRLPESVQRLVIRVAIGGAEAIPWIRAAYDDPIFASVRTGAAAGSDTAAVRSRYRFATAPWVDGRMDQSATLSRASIDALTRLDREYLEFGSILFLTHLQRALKEYQTAVGRNVGAAPADFPGCRFDTALGPVRILGPGVDRIDGSAFLSLDLGGDDQYAGRLGVPLSMDQPIGVAIDLGGDDTYEGGPKPVSLGCGLFGLGAVFDLAGNDRYRSAEAGLGAGYFGAGLLVDSAGDDVYILDTHDGQGSALAGVGLLIDLAGNDSYTCGFSAQGFGETLGGGLLVDVAGNDVYLARDDGNPSALYLNQSVSMAQGVGQGRRADLGDGHSLAGGIGFLVDGAGDDSYHATAWSQGAGYWWAAGFLEDLGGNDRYRNGKYSLGAGAHFAVGCQVDISGDDLYNMGNEAVVNQYQGHARDGSIGISIDGDGNDQYTLRTHCAGSGDLNAIGFFWDRRGDDTYNATYKLLGPANGWTDTPPMGTATVYTPFRSFRDDLDAIGLFLDTGGCDQYGWDQPADSSAASDQKATSPVDSGRGNGREWPSNRSASSRGYGVDVDLFPTAIEW